MKFGGTSVGDAAAFERVLQVVSAQIEKRPVIVTSAMTKVTDALLAAFDIAKKGDAAAAFEAGERMRAHALRAWLAPHEREIARGMTAGERDEERRLATELSNLVVRQERLRDLPKPDVAELEAFDPLSENR